MPQLTQIKRDIKSQGTPERAETSARFFKTAPGQYGHGDIFLGLTVPQQRLIAKQYSNIPLPELEQLLQSREHEFRLTALLILVIKYQQSSDQVMRKQLHEFYLRNTNWINNWDLVDTSAHYLVGDYLRERDKSLLTKLAKSQSLWERRIAMVATYAYIKSGESDEALRIAEILLPDNHDLIHKAVGWMLREVGKHCGTDILEQFLTKHITRLPRTTLRYAIERFTPERRQYFMRIRK